MGRKAVELRKLIIAEKNHVHHEVKISGFALVCSCGNIVQEESSAWIENGHAAFACSVCGSTYLVTKLRMAACSFR
jgi:hypothetical protein